MGQMSGLTSGGPLGYFFLKARDSKGGAITVVITDINTITVFISLVK